MSKHLELIRNSAAAIERKRQEAEARKASTPAQPTTVEKPVVKGRLQMIGERIALMFAHAVLFTDLTMSDSGQSLYAKIEASDCKDMFLIGTDPGTEKQYKIPIKSFSGTCRLDWQSHSLILTEDMKRELVANAIKVQNPFTGVETPLLPPALMELPAAPAPNNLLVMPGGPHEPTDEELEPHTITEAELQTA